MYNSYQKVIYDLNLSGTDLLVEVNFAECEFQTELEYIFKKKS